MSHGGTELRSFFLCDSVSPCETHFLNLYLLSKTNRVIPSFNKDTLKLINSPTSILDNRKYVKTTLECTGAIVSIDFNSTTTEF